MEEIPLLESFRDKPHVAELAFQITGDPPDLARPLFFHDYAQNAFYFTLEMLTQFQRQDAIGRGPYVAPAIAYWFMATESFLSTCAL